MLAFTRLAVYVRPSSTPQSGGQFSDYADRNNTLFQNLLAKPSVRQTVVVQDDGTYAFTGTTGPLDHYQSLARHLIVEQNGYVWPDPTAIQTPYSPSELQLYRDLTGYNLIQAGGIYMVVDDNGGHVPEADRAMVDAAWRMFDSAKGMQDAIGISGDLTPDDLLRAAEWLGSQARLAETDATPYEALIEKLAEKRAAAAVAAEA